MTTKTIFMVMLVSILSGTLFYFSTDFHQSWPLLWFAPIPILIYSYYGQTVSMLAAAFIAFMIGQLNALNYLDTGIPMMPIIYAALFESLIFSLVIFFNRVLVKKYPHIFSVFIFPGLWVCYEFILSFFSSAGELTSFAYNQLHFLSFVQIASLTGIWGVTFVLLLFSSGISYAIYSKNRIHRISSILFAILLPFLCFLYGHNRLHDQQKSLLSVTIGMVSIHTKKLIHDDHALSLSKQYLPLIQEAAQKGAEFIILPEKFVRVTEKNYLKIISLFQKSAQTNKVNLIVGIARLGEISTNSAVIIDIRGNVTAVYDKQHLLPGLEDKFTPGEHLVHQKQPFSWGVAICKDMDFYLPSHDYGELQMQLLIVPALDFNIDAWLHARVAIMRGIENGFAIARAAAHGYLSVTDQMGRVIDITPSFYHDTNVVVKTIHLYSMNTFYSRWGNWFPWVILIFLLTYIIRAVLPYKSIKTAY